MIKLQHLSLQRGNKPLLHQASATLFPGQKIALVGANGSGKSSLFQLLLGQLSADDGDIDIPSQWQISHMAQEVATSDRPALDYVMDGDSQLRQVQAAIARAEASDNHEQLATLYEQLDTIDGYTATTRAEQLMQGLGFSTADLNKPANDFSGGWRIRLNLAQALMSPADLMLLDEPTNHLDLDAELWLEQWLQQYQGSLLLISHDRDFIDAVCEGILHLEHRTLTRYTGNYSAFERQRAEQLAQQQASFEKQQQRREEIQRFVQRFRAKATKAKQAQSRLKELARMEDIAPAHVDSPFGFQFPEPKKFSDPLLNLSHSALGYGDSIIIENANLSIHPGSRIGLLGANGAGKSTLVKTLAKEIDLLGGERVAGENLALGYFSQHQLEALDINASPLLHLQRLSPKAREQDIRNFLGGFNFHGDSALESIAHFSGGEKARLALAIVVWQQPNLLLLDEPTNHLDLEMCHALTVALQDFQGAVIVISHDRHLLRNTVDQFLLVGNGSIQSYEGDLEDYGKWLLSRNSEDKTTEASRIDNKKQQRQLAAEQRKKLQPITKKIKQLEQQIQKADKQLADIEQQLGDTDLYQDENKNQLQTLLREQGALTSKKNECEEEWLLLSEELELLQG